MNKHFHFIIIVSPITGRGYRVAEHLINSLHVFWLCVSAWVCVKDFPVSIPSNIQSDMKVRGIHSCIACLGQMHLIESTPLQVRAQLMSFHLKAQLGHGYMSSDCIGRETPPYPLMSVYEAFYLAMPCHYCSVMVQP